jgi:hypothetical protein
MQIRLNCGIIFMAISATNETVLRHFEIVCSQLRIDNSGFFAEDAYNAGA